MVVRRYVPEIKLGEGALNPTDASEAPPGHLLLWAHKIETVSLFCTVPLCNSVTIFNSTSNVELISGVIFVN